MLPTSRDCVICGKDNPIGVKLRWEPTPTGVSATTLMPEHFQGFKGVLHGGLVCALLDDAMWWAIYTTRKAVTLTAEITVRYKAPVSVASPLTVRADLVEARGSRIFSTSGQVLNAEGKVLAEATGKFMAAPADLAPQLLRAIEQEA